jgi:hypothetical protein
MNSFITLDRKRADEAPKKQGFFSRLWDNHCTGEQQREAERAEIKRAEKVAYAYTDINDHATPEERAIHAVEDIDLYALPKQAIEAARLAITRASTDGGNGPKLDGDYTQRLLKVLFRIEEEMEGKHADVKVYADVSAVPDSASDADKAFGVSRLFARRQTGGAAVQRRQVCGTAQTSMRWRNTAGMRGS